MKVPTMKLQVVALLLNVQTAFATPVAEPEPEGMSPALDMRTVPLCVKATGKEDISIQMSRTSLTQDAKAFA